VVSQPSPLPPSLPDSLIAHRDLYRRVLNFTNSHTNYNLGPEGQEFFTVIQYNKTDQYT
jgi:hypothetical protein